MANYLTSEDATEFERVKERSRARLTEFLATLALHLNVRDDHIANQLGRDNASAKSKLGKIYALMAEVGEAVAPFVACGKGCTSPN
ncbi:MAG: hypothetical protein Q7K57_08085 [Burkholderiaceae bacterium]|nr:hypothetical protein [Polaromonas sp.]MDO8768647.1 hypothetical protein [Burkholderiaceae bacterium]